MVGIVWAIWEREMGFGGVKVAKSERVRMGGIQPMRVIGGATSSSVALEMGWLWKKGMCSGTVRVTLRTVAKSERVQMGGIRIKRVLGGATLSIVALMNGRVLRYAMRVVIVARCGYCAGEKVTKLVEARECSSGNGKRVDEDSEAEHGE